MLSNPISAMLFAMECEGLIDTPEGKRNKFIKEVRSGAAGYLSLDEIREKAATAGFDPYNIEIIIEELENDRYRSNH